MPTSSPAPVLVEALRGDMVESVHRGSAVAADAAGRVVAAWGQPARPIYPRSAVKPLQALPLIESGAADAFALGDAEIALACASHSGAVRHERPILAWLKRIGLTAADLECGAHPPLDAAAARALARQGRQPSAVHNNCSGKHLGFLTTARHLGEPTAGYIGRDHPVQRRVAEALAAMTGLPVESLAWAGDGCGIPTFALPLAAIAAGMARLADPRGLTPARIAAAERIRAAMTAHPELVAGEGRLCTAVMRAAPEVLLKGGAEGVYAASLPRLGLGVAVKIDDGAGRAAEVVVMAVLARLGAFTEAERTALAERFRPILRNVAGRPVGCLRPAANAFG